MRQSLTAQEQGRLMEILSSGWPIKVLLQIDDLHDEADSGEGGSASGLRSRQLASLAMGLNDVYVLQSSSSNLFQFRERVLKGVTYAGPSLFSVYSGSDARKSGLAPYLMAAAAMESRAFPAFTYDPSAGANWADRFYLEANTQVERDWPVKGFAYEDEQHQSVSEDLSFTLVDFLASDRRYASHLARVPREKWNGSLIRIEESLARERKGLPDKIPSLLMVDGENRLQKVIVDQSLIRQAGRCRDMWHSLQELGGVNNSHAQKLLAREQKAWQEQLSQSQAQAAPAAAPAAAAATAAPAAGNRSRSGRAGGRATLAGRSLYRDGALLDLQRVHARSTARCSPTTATSKPTSPTSTRALMPSWCRPPKAARWRSSIRASRATPTSRGSKSCSSGLKPSPEPRRAGVDRARGLRDLRADAVFDWNAAAGPL